jgi:hypothetical protein
MTGCPAPYTIGKRSSLKEIGFAAIASIRATLLSFLHVEPKEARAGPATASPLNAATPLPVTPHRIADPNRQRPC